MRSRVFDLRRALFVLLTVAGVSLARARGPAARAQESPVVDVPYVLHAGDALDIKVYNLPELNEQVVIRPDGMITSVLGAEVKAAGLRPAALAARLAELYGKTFRTPRVSVSVASFSAQHVFIGGEVTNPGVVPLDGSLTLSTALIRAGAKESASLREVTLVRGSSRQSFNVAAIIAQKLPDVPLRPGDTIYVPQSTINVYVGGEVQQPGLETIQGNLSALTAIIKAGGALHTANMKGVLLIRNDIVSGRPQVRTVDLRDALAGRSNDPVLQPFDVIYVPRTRISKVDQFVDQWLRQTSPVPLNGGFSYLLNNPYPVP